VATMKAEPLNGTAYCRPLAPIDDIPRFAVSLSLVARTMHNAFFDRRFQEKET